jgi:hypothetical protein
MTNRTCNLIAVVVALTAATAGLTLASPAVADPDLGHQICNAIGQRGANLGTFLMIEHELDMKMHMHSDQTVAAVKESIDTDCPQYRAAWAQADRQAGIENQHINGNY